MRSSTMRAASVVAWESRAMSAASRRLASTSLFRRAKSALRVSLGLVDKGPSRSLAALFDDLDDRARPLVDLGHRQAVLADPGRLPVQRALRKGAQGLDALRQEGMRL